MYWLASMLPRSSSALLHRELYRSDFFSATIYLSGPRGPPPGAMTQYSRRSSGARSGARHARSRRHGDRIRYPITATTMAETTLAQSFDNYRLSPPSAASLPLAAALENERSSSAVHTSDLTHAT